MIDQVQQPREPNVITQQDLDDLTVFLERVEFRGQSAVHLARLFRLTSDINTFLSQTTKEDGDHLLNALNNTRGIGKESIVWVSCYKLVLEILTELTKSGD